MVTTYGCRGTKCKNPPQPRSNIRTNGAVHQRNALALSLPTVRVLWADAAHCAGSVHLSSCTAVQTSETTHRPRRRKHPKIYKTAARRWRAPNQTRRRPSSRNARRRKICFSRASSTRPCSPIPPPCPHAPSRGGSSAHRGPAYPQAAGTHASCAARCCDCDSASSSHARGAPEATGPGRTCRAQARRTKIRRAHTARPRPASSAPRSKTSSTACPSQSHRAASHPSRAGRSGASPATTRCDSVRGSRPCFCAASSFTTTHSRAETHHA